jgi:hypothetical protein
MKPNSRQEQSKLARSLARGLAALAFCAVTLGPTFAFGGGERDKVVVPGAGPGAAIGDETIGTLPIWAGNGGIELVRGLPILRPSLFLEGNLLEVQNAISFFSGTARAEVVPLDPAWQRVRLVFVDEVMLGFDRVSLAGAGLEFGVWMPDRIPHACPNLSFGGRSFTMQPTESRLALPLAALSASGALDASPLCVESGSLFGSNALMVAVNQDFLYLVQRH